MNQLVTFYSQTEGGRRLVGVGLTDDMIAHIKSKGIVMEPGARGGVDTDVMLFYGETLNKLMAQIHRVFPKEKTDVRVI
jgi:hypothetical protein